MWYQRSFCVPQCLWQCSTQYYLQLLAFTFVLLHFVGRMRVESTPICDSSLEVGLVHHLPGSPALRPSWSEDWRQWMGWHIWDKPGPKLTCLVAQDARCDHNCASTGVGAHIAIIGMLPAAFGCCQAIDCPWWLCNLSPVDSGFLSSSIFMATGAIDIWRTDANLELLHTQLLAAS